MFGNVACANRAMSAQMMNHSRREKLTPGPSVKRKGRDGPGPFDVLKPSPLTTKKLAKPSPHHRHPPPPRAAAPISKPSPPPPQQPLSNNHLLAGYLAHEFLSKGTLFGEPWDPARAEAVPVSAAGASRLRQPGTNNNQNGKQKRGKAEPTREMKDSSAAAAAGSQPQGKSKEAEKQQRYMEIADLLKTEGAHIPGIVNPTQLGRYLQLG